ncbi:MAG TPA: oxidoreductase [Pseudonocardiaceae bacterium]|nr:oxidoreductase [Pseudonocardiaceae bacterium]
MGWSAADVPDQTGRTAVVTGGNAGIGLDTARVLADRGARVVLAGRDPDKGRRAAEGIGGDVDVVRLDLASLASVHAAAEAVRDTCPALDLLINNAGVMAAPRARTEDGIELTFATNHIGHFAFTGLLLDLLRPGGRVVTVSSNAHDRATGDFATDDPALAYPESKLANLLFTYELDHRLGGTRAALAAHPGTVGTALWRTSSPLERILVSDRLRPINFWYAQGAAAGALPTLRAATDPAARGGDYFGPGGWFQATGAPVRVESTPLSHDTGLRQRLWELSERLTSVRYPVVVP